MTKTYNVLQTTWAINTMRSSLLLSFELLLQEVLWQNDLQLVHDDHGAKALCNGANAIEIACSSSQLAVVFR